MKVFASNYLEPIQENQTNNLDEWTWEPYTPDIKKIYASGAKTATRASTYAAEKDNKADTDRPNEGS